MLRYAMCFHDLCNTCLLGGFNPAFLGDSLGFFPNFELRIKKDTLDRCVQLAWTIGAMQQWDNIHPHVVVRQFHIVGNSISAILVDGIQLTQFGESLNHSDNKAVETWVDVAPSQSINVFLFTVRPPELETRYSLRFMLLCLTCSQTKSISLCAVDLTSHHGLVPSALLLVEFKCLEPDL